MGSGTGRGDGLSADPSWHGSCTPPNGPLGESRRGFPLRFLPPRRSRGRFAFAAALCVAVASALLANGLHAAELFLPVGPGVAPAASGPAARSASAGADSWERHVRVARHELAAARANVENAGAGRLLLNVRDGVRLDVAVERTAPTRYGYSLSGRVAGGADQAGFATLVVHEKAVAASIWTPNFAYELSYLGDGIHALKDVTNAPPVECAGAVPVKMSAADTRRQAGTDDGSVVDVLVVWTPAKEEGAGGETQMLSVVDLMLASTNDAFERSGALVSLNLVGAERVDYSEVDASTDIGRLVDPDDGHMDEVHDRRDVLGADLVHLQAEVHGGRASGSAFSVNAFAHEVGHNFGIQHDRGEFFGSFGVGNYDFGFTTASCTHTIMSYRTRCTVFKHGPPFYGSPWRYGVTGRALGVSRFSKERGLHGPADAVLTLNRNRHRLANLRPSRDGG